MLFWHNHFVSAFSSLNGWSIALARQNQMFRRLCIGSFRDLLIAVLQDPAMLNYLDNDKNRKQRPNENLGRELMELFTLGEGHFTEKDVKEASRALTGWRVSRAKNLSFWNDGWTHDKGHKLILGREGKFGPLNLVDILLDQPQTASYITRKFWRYFISETWNEPKGIGAMGGGALDRAYEASDGWVYIHAGLSDLNQLSNIEGLSGIESLTGRALPASLEERIQGSSVDTWVGRLTEAGVSAQKVITDVKELMADPWVVSHGLSLTREHDDIGLVTTCGPAPRLSRTPVRAGRPAPRPGSDAREILDQHGLGGRFDDLLLKGIILDHGVSPG